MSEGVIAKIKCGSLRELGFAIATCQEHGWLPEDVDFKKPNEKAHEGMDWNAYCSFNRDKCAGRIFKGYLYMPSILKRDQHFYIPAVMVALNTATGEIEFHFDTHGKADKETMAIIARIEEMLKRAIQAGNSVKKIDDFVESVQAEVAEQPEMDAEKKHIRGKIWVPNDKLRGSQVQAGQ